MAIQEDILGDWVGKYDLWLEPGDPVSSKSTLNAKSRTDGSIEATYTWTYEGALNTGSYKISFNGDVVVLTDPFHTQGAPLECKATAPFDVFGTYEVEGQKWGWRTLIQVPTSERLEITAWFVTPTGEETLATNATYKCA